MVTKRKSSALALTNHSKNNVNEGSSKEENHEKKKKLCSLPEKYKLNPQTSIWQSHIISDNRKNRIAISFNKIKISAKFLG